MSSALRHDLLTLRRIVTAAAELHPTVTPRRWALLSTLRDYLIWLTLDGLQDEELARRLAPTLATLREELSTATSRRGRTKAALTATGFYQGFLFALEGILSFTHGVDLLRGGEITREEFNESWELARRALNL